MKDKEKKMSRSERGRLGALALNSNREKKSEAARKAAETRGYESLAAAGRKGGIALRGSKKGPRRKKEEHEHSKGQ